MVSKRIKIEVNDAHWRNHVAAKFGFVANADGTYDISRMVVNGARIFVLAKSPKCSPTYGRNYTILAREEVKIITELLDVELLLD